MHGTCISSCLEIACYCSDFLGIVVVGGEGGLRGHDSG